MDERPTKRRGPLLWIADRKSAPAIIVGALLCCVAPAWLTLLMIEHPLLQEGILNTKDLPPIVGNELGTVSDYFLNVWHWDAMLFLGMLASLPCLFAGISILMLRRQI